MHSYKSGWTRKAIEKEIQFKTINICYFVPLDTGKQYQNKCPFSYISVTCHILDVRQRHGQMVWHNGIFTISSDIWLTKHIVSLVVDVCNISRKWPPGFLKRVWRLIFIIGFISNENLIWSFVKCHWTWAELQSVATLEQ